MKNILMIFFASMLVVSDYSGNVQICFAQNDYEITLTDGRTIIVNSYYERDGLVCYQKYGAEVRIDKNKVKAIKKLKIRKDIETVEYQGINEDTDNVENTELAPLSDDPYELYSEAVSDKREAKFEEAKRKLDAALSLLKDQKEKKEEYKKIEDELEFYLPIEIARWHIENEKLGNVEKNLDRVEKYIQNHPRRFEMRSNIEYIYNALRDLQLKMCDRAEQDAVSISNAITQYFSSNKKNELPSKKILFSLMNYEPVNDCEIEGSKNQTITIKVTDKSNGCNRGKIFVFELPAKSSVWLK